MSLPIGRRGYRGCHGNATHPCKKTAPNHRNDGTKIDPSLKDEDVCIFCADCCGKRHGGQCCTDHSVLSPGRKPKPAGDTDTKLDGNSGPDADGDVHMLDAATTKSADDAMAKAADEADEAEADPDVGTAVSDVPPLLTPRVPDTVLERRLATQSKAKRKSGEADAKKATDDDHAYDPSQPANC